MLILGLLASKNERLNLQIPLPSLEDSIASFCSLCLLFFIFVAGLSHKNRLYFTPKISSILSCLTCQFSCLSNYLKSFHSTITLMTGDDTVFFVWLWKLSSLCAVILLNTIPLSMLNSNSQLQLLHLLFVLSI